MIYGFSPATELWVTLKGGFLDNYEIRVTNESIMLYDPEEKCWAEYKIDATKGIAVNNPGEIPPPNSSAPAAESLT